MRRATDGEREQQEHDEIAERLRMRELDAAERWEKRQINRDDRERAGDESRAGSEEARAQGNGAREDQPGGNLEAFLQGDGNNHCDDGEPNGPRVSREAV